MSETLAGARSGLYLQPPLLTLSTSGDTPSLSAIKQESWALGTQRKEGQEGDGVGTGGTGGSGDPSSWGGDIGPALPASSLPTDGRQVGAVLEHRRMVQGTAVDPH
jgi:hypothetical protein